MAAVADRLPRLLALVPYLLARPGIPLVDAARDLGVSPEQVRRDLELLWVCGLPGHGPGDLIDLSFDDESVTVTYDAGMSRPLRLTADEGLALTVALRTLADVEGLTERDAIERALAKIESAIGTQTGAGAAGSAGVAVRLETVQETLTVVEQALASGRALDLTYWSAGRDETTRRVVDPVRVLLVDGRSYLEAWCRRAEAMRLFRLDRIDAVHMLDEPSTPPRSAEPRDLVGGLYQPSPGAAQVTLRLAGAARWVADYYPCERVEEQPDGDLIVVMNVADTPWLRQLVLGSGGDAHVLQPADLAAEIAATAQRALTAYADATGATEPDATDAFRR